MGRLHDVQLQTGRGQARLEQRLSETRHQSDAVSRVSQLADRIGAVAGIIDEQGGFEGGARRGGIAETTDRDGQLALEIQDLRETARRAEAAANAMEPF